MGEREVGSLRFLDRNEVSFFLCIKTRIPVGRSRLMSPDDAPLSVRMCVAIWGRLIVSGDSGAESQSTLIRSRSALGSMFDSDGFQCFFQVL